MPEALQSAIHLVLQMREARIARLSANVCKSAVRSNQRHHSAQIVGHRLGRILARAIDLRLTFEFVDRHRPADQISLREVGAERLQPLELFADSTRSTRDRHVETLPKVFLTVIQKDGSLKAVDRL